MNARLQDQAAPSSEEPMQSFFAKDGLHAQLARLQFSRTPDNRENVDPGGLYAPLITSRQSNQGFAWTISFFLACEGLWSRQSRSNPSR
jgi:hypothetical protein